MSKLAGGRRQAAQRMDSRDQNDNATRVPFYLNLFSASGGAGRRALLNDTDDLGTSCASFSFLHVPGLLPVF